jgi:uncharacterized protein (TIGR02453 family)
MFKGFSRETVSFFTDLKENNNKMWFEEHRQDYENWVLGPSIDFIRVMEKLFHKVSPAIVADPRVNRSIFRIHRDTRFSREKTPYKTNLALWFWEGDGPRMECPGFYFHLEPPMLMLAAGIHVFPKYLLEEYRRSVVDNRHGMTLARALAEVRKKGEYEIGEKHFKQVPRGFDKNHRNAEYLLFNGLDVFIEEELPPELYGEELPAYCMERFMDMWPIHTWLLGVVERGTTLETRVRRIRRK